MSTPGGTPEHPEAAEILPTCLRCRGRRIVPGRFVTAPDGRVASGWFHYGIPRGFWRRIGHAFSLVGKPTWIRAPLEAFLCLDCGTAWASIDPEAAVENVRLFGDADLKRRLGLARTPSLRDELA